MSPEELCKLIEAHPIKGSPEEMRRAFRNLTEPACAAVPEPEDVDLDGIEAERHGRRGGQPILLFTDGGYVFGSPETHRGFAHTLSELAGRDVVVPRLPQGPEAPWPAQKEAAKKAIGELTTNEGGHPQGPIVAGGSAGGHLALLSTRGTHVKTVLAFSPNTLRDYGLSNSRGAERDLMNDHESDHRLAEKVFGTIDADDPDQTLMRSEEWLLPETYISVGTDEVLRDDSVQYAAWAAAKGANVTFRSWAGGFHMEELFAPLWKGGVRRLQEASAWLRSQSG